MSSNLRPDPNKAIAFLRWLTIGAKLYLENMNSQGASRPKGKTYLQGDDTAAIQFVASNNNDQWQRNLYFVADAEFLAGPRKKENLTAVRFLHVDLDHKDYPGGEKEQDERILNLLFEVEHRPKGIPHPTAIWFTGGGYQAVWRLAEPISIAEAEELNRALLFALQGGAGTHDAGRLLRLPWTMNWLNDKKRASGRAPKVAVHLHPAHFDEPPVSYSVNDFDLPRAEREPKLPLVPAANSGAQLEIRAEPLPDDLSEIVPPDEKWAKVIMTGKNPPNKPYGSRSELVFAATLWMLGKGMKPGHVVSIITDPDFGISAHVLDNPNPLKYGIRQVQRALTVLETKIGGWPAVNKDGFPYAHNPKNIRYAFAQLGIHAQRNLFTQTDEVSGFQLGGRDLNDIGEILCSAFSRDLNFVASPAAIKRELISVAHENRFHPVIEYLDDLVWDGVPRIDRWLATYCGANDNELNAEFGSKFLIAGVRRIKQPGVKFDTMLVLEGAQGAGKSQLAVKLAIRDEWFCGSLDLKSDDKTKAELLSRAWIVECQELDGLNKTTSQSLKKFLSTAIDLFRAAYARNATEFRRHCIILGTTNDFRYLRDLTGNRRIWPVAAGEIDMKGFFADVDQLWAEAVVRERQGGSIVLSKHLWEEARRVQGFRMVEDEFAEVLIDNFDGRTGKVSMDSIKLLLNLDTSRMSPDNARRINAAMERLGWEFGTHRLHDLAGKNHRPRKGFARGTPDERSQEIYVTQNQGGAVVVEYRKGPPDIPF
ncbi:VapE domain-containing protein [Ruegeria atlantica]|uniref:VapE domain-containing protein n=1 Tax=Ruegeria atlantica TaxID=81569 RepID=UPI0014815090|nr:VapE domain-containing protein [Ruegeria atlantica]